MENKLDPEFKAKWVAALRSGEYKQGESNLYFQPNDTYCCLGVAGAICGVPKELMNRNPFFFERELTGDASYYPIQLAEGMPHVKHLMKMNDEGQSFSEIADYIEANL